eukprot:4561877-Prymnesium_polylepis.1
MRPVASRLSSAVASACEACGNSGGDGRQQAVGEFISPPGARAHGEQGGAAAGGVRECRESERAEAEEEAPAGGA